jgi:hypothetical protein
MELRTRVVGAGTAILVAGALGLAPGVTAANAASAARSAVSAAQLAPAPIPVTGTLPDGTAFTGTLSKLSSSVVNGVLQLKGTITGKGLPAGGTNFTAPIKSLAANGGCTILTLDLGALNLDLLGLVANLNPVHLVATAVPGAGKLLGNLLCSVAGLLDKNGPATAVSALLNKILTVLG